MLHARILPHTYFEHASVGKCALSSLIVGQDQLSLGLSRSGFIYQQMETATGLPLSLLVLEKNMLCSPSCWARSFYRVAG